MAVSSSAQHDFDLATRACGAIDDSCLVVDSADSDAALLDDSAFKRTATASTLQHIGNMSTVSPSARHDASAPSGAWSDHRA